MLRRLTHLLTLYMYGAMVQGTSIYIPTQTIYPVLLWVVTTNVISLSAPKIGPGPYV